jgi:hypothetical protein
MAQKVTSILDNRDLTKREEGLVRWLLEHGEPIAQQFLTQLDDARVFSRCPCGCASVDFAIAGKRPTQFGLRVLSDFQWQDEKGHLFGVFVFEQDGLLAGLDLWSIDGQSTATQLPAVELLRALGRFKR